MNVDSPSRRAWSALPTTIVVHGVMALLGAGSTAVVDRGLQEIVASGGGLSSALELALISPLWVRTWVTHLLVLGAALCLLSPWLRLAWLHALSSGRSTAACASFALPHWTRALAQSWLIGLACLLGSLPFAALTLTLWEQTAQQPEPMRLYLVGTSLLPLALWWGLCAAWRDLAAAVLAAHERFSLRDLKRALWLAAHPTQIASFLLHGTLALTCAAAAMLILQASAGLPALALAQLMLLTRSVVRSRWLGVASLLAEPSHSR